MAKSTMSVETAAVESAMKSISINRESSKVMNLQKAMDNFRKLVSKHDVENERVHIYYYAKLSSAYKLQFSFFRPNSEAYNFKHRSRYLSWRNIDFQSLLKTWTLNYTHYNRPDDTKLNK